MLVQTHTGATAYSGTIESGIARLYIKTTWAAAVTEADNTKLTLSLASKGFTGTIIPELTFKQLADIAGYIDGVRYDHAANKTLEFSLPISLGGSYSNEGTITYSISGATATNTIAVHAIDDPKKETDFISIVPVGCVAGAAKTVSAIDVVYAFIDPSKLTRVKISFKDGKSVEYLAAELLEVARVLNPVQVVTALGAVTPGSNLLMGVNVSDAVEMEITMSSADNIFLVKHQNQ